MHPLFVLLFAGLLVEVVAENEHPTEPTTEQVPPLKVKKRPQLHVLWIGNSYTSMHDLPAMFLHLNLSLKVHNRKFVPGGYTLGDDRPQIHQLLERQPWDWVILQDQSQIPGFTIDMEEYGATAMTQDMLGNYYIDAIKKAGAKALLFQTWGRKDGCNRFPDHFPNYVAHQHLLKQGYSRYLHCLRYKDTGGKHGEPSGLEAYIAPVGEAFEYVYKQERNVFKLLYEGDAGGHPSVFGTYLASLVIYTRIFNRSPVGLPSKPSAVNLQTAQYLQEVAEKVALDYVEKNCDASATCNGRGYCEPTQEYCVCEPPNCGLVCDVECGHEEL